MLENGCNCNLDKGKKLSVKDYLLLLLGRKVIMLIFCLFAASILNLIYNMDIEFVVYLYGAFAGGNMLEHFANRPK